MQTEIRRRDLAAARPHNALGLHDARGVQIAKHEQAVRKAAEETS